MTSLRLLGLIGLLVGLGSLPLSDSVYGQEAKKNQPAKKQPAPKPKQAPKKQEVTQPEDLDTLPGFKVELLYTADPAKEGSWINLAVDNKGRLIIGGQRNQPMLRATLKDGKVDKMEPLGLPITEVMGILYAHDSLYVMGNGPDANYGLFRCKDTNGDDKFDDIKVLKDFRSGGEHGAHAIVLGPDNNIWVMIGNHVNVPPGMSDASPLNNYGEDLLLPRQWDGNGHATGRLAPGGYVVRTDPEGKDWHLMLGGFRNAYDMAFNGDGELFTFDSDMEWDWGMPWYRPTRINHCTSGSEFGWRSGTGKWPEYFADSLPETVDIGIGSPTGVCNGQGAKFPAKYQKALFVCDWSYGRLIAVHLTPNGSSYTATFENFVAPKGLDGKSPRKPLNLTDAVVGQDGAIYFTIGGRNNQAALYRVSYTGKEPTEPTELKNDKGETDRAIRQELETYHGKQDPKAIPLAWPYLNSPDRFLRYAARIAVESQPVEEWQSMALSETKPTAAIHALLALSRSADRKVQPELLEALTRFKLDDLNEEQKLAKLRALQLSFIRQGRPSNEWAKRVIDEIEPHFPGETEPFNREAATLLIYLNSANVAEKCLKLMAEAKTQEDRMFYLFHLRTLPIGFWTLDQRKQYLEFFTKDRGKLAHPEELTQWFEDVGRPYSDGNSFNNFLKNFLREYVSTLSDQELKELKPQIAAIDKAATETIEVPPRDFVKKWTMDELVPVLDQANRGRNFEKGKQAYLAAQCAKCHRFGDFGGSVGPDLTAVASRFDRKALLESIVEPSKVLSEQYQNETVQTLDGRVLTGRVVDEDEKSITIQQDPLDSKRDKVLKDDIETRKPSPISPMPAGLIDVLTRDEILDLIAYLEAAGRRQHQAFQK